MLPADLRAGSALSPLHSTWNGSCTFGSEQLPASWALCSLIHSFIHSSSRPLRAYPLPGATVSRGTPACRHLKTHHRSFGPLD